ncbi:NAD(+) diphosphatase [Roseibium denhamense]|uniref:NAD(+) diphosphatase n=1 Tax=Roseibium denhamense TaxID=76305 RepID=A0ABY1PLG8_9HYPH|nr:NAD(+) diphosphatase [Roseibium denhamense]MTI06903.1 NAD(+) diphosphatase [Roseibium denhamense]SMP36789.1 NAD+ diphosphatase [Roseibium denhamense]
MRAPAFGLSALDMSFLGNELDRQSTRRSDTAYINMLLHQSTTEIILSTARTLVFAEAAELRIGHSLTVAEALEADRNEMVFLGIRRDSGQALFATTIPYSEEDLAARSDLRLQDLRNLALQNAFSQEDLGALAQARALIHWQRTHQYCSRCGHKSDLAEAGYRRDCPNCGGTHFPRTDPCVIMLITDGDRALLGRPARLPEGIYTTLAGFMEPGETVEQAVRRETLEESGVEVGDVRLISNQPWPFPANLMLGCIGEATSSGITIEDDELEACKWCNREEVRQMVSGTHPEGHLIPPSISIAYHLITNWLDGAIS